MYKRYAVYYLPPQESALADFGASWFGYDIRSGKHCTRLKLDGLDLEKLTQTASNYGFHATLKAPFVLRKKFDVDQLCQRIEKQAKKAEAFSFSSMKVANMAGFLALLPVNHRAKMVHLEERLVKKLNKYGKKPSKQLMDKRRKVELNALELNYLEEYGYPYVLDHFRFHMTLLDKTDKNIRKAVQGALLSEFEALLSAPLPLEEIALVGERDDGTFIELQRFPLGQSE